MDTPLTDFLQQLQRDGQAVVPTEIAELSAKDERSAKALLGEWQTADRLHWPATPPSFDEAAALWSAVYIYRAAQFFVHRDYGERQLQQALKPYLGKIDDFVMYSVDGCLRHLPRLHHKAKSLSQDDALVALLEQTARTFPLSSVGIDAEGPWEAATVLQHPSLKLMYVDRIIEHRDKSRLEEAETRAAVEAALGNHASSFWPGLK
jgi:hypothetical protein